MAVAASGAGLWAGEGLDGAVEQEGSPHAETGSLRAQLCVRGEILRGCLGWVEVFSRVSLASGLCPIDKNVPQRLWWGCEQATVRWLQDGSLRRWCPYCGFWHAWYLDLLANSWAVEEFTFFLLGQCLGLQFTSSSRL